MSWLKSRGVLLIFLGFFIDFFDLSAFAATRGSILNALSVPLDRQLSYSTWVFNLQALGILLGGFLSGQLADRFGRVWSIRLGIFFYSLAMLASALCTDALLFLGIRFLAMLALAGELAISMTLLSELLASEHRLKASGWLYASGLLGGLSASILAQMMSWRLMFALGALMGFFLLLLRLRWKESRVFQNLPPMSALPRGNFLQLFRSYATRKKLLLMLSIGFPFWFIVYCVNFSPEVASLLKYPMSISHAMTLHMFFLGSLVGALFWPYCSIYFKSHRKSLVLAFSLMMVSIAAFPALTLSLHFYILMAFLGLSSSYALLLNLYSTELFGSNQRATATSIISNTGRSATLLINVLIPWMSKMFGLWGLIGVGLLFFFSGITPLFWLKETYGRNIDFVES